MVAAMRTKWPETVRDWMGSLRDMKAGWRWRSWSGGGGDGSGIHFDEMGSKEKN